MDTLNSIAWEQFEVQPPEPSKKCAKHPSATYSFQVATKSNRKKLERHIYGRTYFTCLDCDKILGWAKLTPMGEELTKEITKVKQEHRTDPTEPSQREQRDAAIISCAQEYAQKLKRRTETPDGNEDSPPKKKRRLNKRETESMDVDEKESEIAPTKKKSKKKNSSKNSPKAVKRKRSKPNDASTESPKKKSKSSSSLKKKEQWHLTLEGLPRDVRWEMFEVLNANMHCSIGNECEWKGKRHFHCQDVTCLVDGATPGPQPSRDTAVHATGEGQTPGFGAGVLPLFGQNLDPTFKFRWIGRTGRDIAEHFAWHGNHGLFARGKTCAEIEQKISGLEDSVRAKQIEITTSHQDSTHRVSFAQLNEWAKRARDFKTDIESIVRDEPRTLNIIEEEVDDELKGIQVDIVEQIDLKESSKTKSGDSQNEYHGNGIRTGEPTIGG